MTALLRMLLLASALLTSGALQVVAVAAGDACCEDVEEGAGVPCPECPIGIACGCCAARGAVQPASPSIAPRTSAGIAVALAAAEPADHAPDADIFHPPRA